MKILAIEPLEARIAPATLSIASVSLNEGNAGVTTFDFTVTLAGEITENVTVNYATADGTATTADADYVHAAGQITFTPGGPAEHTISVSVQGDVVLEQNQTFLVNLSGATGATLGQAQATGTILSEELPTLSINDPAMVDEGGAGATANVGFTVTLNGQINTPLTINYTTADGTATIADNDYVAKSGTLTFNPGQATQTQTVTVQIKGDGTPENNETFFVDLTNPVSGSATLEKARGVGTIRNDELVVIRLDSPQITEGDSGTQELVFTATLIGEITSNATVNYMTVDGTAKAGSDYTATQGQFVFVAGGSKTQTISVPISGDTLPEQDEQFTLRLTNRNNVEQATGIGKILTDELPTLAIDDPHVIEGTGGTNSMIFTVSLTGEATSNVTVNYATSSGTAIANTDFTTANGVLTFLPGEVTKTISVPITTDSLAELTETFAVTLSSATGAVITKAQGTGSILDDEPAAFTIGDAQIVEGSSGTSNLAFTVILTGAISANATVNFQTADDTALAGEDYAAQSGSLTFTPGGPATQTILVPIFGDTAKELDERFFIDLSGATGADLARARAAGTILADEVSVSIDDAQIFEGGQGMRNLVFTVRLSEEIVGPATVHFATANGTATAGSDYTSTTGTLSFTPGESLTQTISVPIIGDLTTEPDETFTVTLTSPTGVVIGDGTATGTILNDERTLTVSTGQVIEGDVGNASMVFDVALSAASPYDVVVTYSTADQTATTADKDYVPATASTITIPAGQTTGAIVIPVIGDLKKEGNETFVVNVTSADAVVQNLQVIGTITDDDPKLSITDLVVTEGDAGTQTAVFTVLLSSAQTSAVTVKYATQDGAGETGARDGVGDDGIVADYVAVTNGSLTFNAGETSKTISITVHNDTIRELQENIFHVKLLSAELADGDEDPDNNPQIAFSKDTGTATIIDNDDAAPTLSIGDVSVLENVAGGNAIFTVSLSQATDLPVAVDLSTLDGTALAGSDFTAAASTLTFAPGVTTRTGSVAITPDATVEADETFSVKLANALIGGENAQQPMAIADDTGVGTIRNDDVTVSIASAASLDEDGGNMEFTVTLSQAAVADVVVRYSTANGTAVAPGDFTAAVDQFITIPAGETTGIISIPIIDDTTDEQDETFTVTLSSATNAILAPAGISGTGTIIDATDAPTLSINDVTVTEGNSGTSLATFTVTLSAASFQTIKVDYATEDGAGDSGAKDGVDDTLAKDYEAATGTLTFAPGELTKTISVTIVGDTIHEALENLFAVKLSNGRVDAEGGDAVAITDDTGTGTIHDPGDALPALRVGDVSLAENGGNAVFTVTLSSVSDLPVTVAFSTADNGAVAGSDYTATSGTITFDPNDPVAANRTALTIPIALLDDSVSETDELFSLNLSNPVNAVIADGLAAGRILNDDATLRIVAFGDAGTSAIAVDEDGGSVAKFKVILDGAAPGATTTVHYTTAAGTAVSTGARPDFTATSGTLVFSGTTTELFIDVPITADAHYELNEQFTVVLSQPVNALVASGGGTGTVTITNNDAKPTLTITDASLVEGNTGTTSLVFTAKLSAANEVDPNVSFNAATEDGTAISTGDKKDFTALTTAPFVFAKGDVERTISIPIAGDLRDEDDQTFKVNLTSLSTGATFAGGAASIFATGTIIDDDAAPFVSISDVALGENDTGLANTQFKVTLYNAAGAKVESEKLITVDYTTVDGTAKAGSDFTAKSGTLTFAPGTQEILLTVPLIDDALAEDTETFGVTLANAVNAPLGDASATGTITDNDATSKPVLTINDISFTEGDSGTTNAIFTVSLSGATGQVVTVNFATADGTAKAAGPFADYLATSGSLTFDPNDPDPARRLTQTISVPVIGDIFSEASEAFTVNLSSAVNATLGDAGGTATILNGSDAVIGLALPDAQTTEGNSGSKTLTFTAQLSGPAASDVTFTLATLGGTALAGNDFGTKNEAKTIAAGATTATFDVTIGGDTAWEATESFFVNLTGASANVQVVDADPIGSAQATARGFIFNDDVNFVGGNKIQWIDVDGDFVTLTASKGVFSFNALNPTSNTNDLTLVKESGPGGADVGGYELQLLNLITNNISSFAGAHISITATKQPGFPLASDGRVDVGWIAATNFLGDTVQIVGIDLASVTVDGDLAKITAGDTFSTTAIGKLDVYSLGARGTSTLPSDVTDNESKVIGPISTVLVKQNVEGFLNVIGEEFGTVSTLKIGGALKGGSATASGVVSVSGRIGSATIGSIIGGAGDNSGLLFVAPEDGGSIGKVTILGDIVGGGGKSAGKILAAKIGNVSAGNVIGGAGEGSGAVISNSSLGNVTLSGGIIGGAGKSSGFVLGTTTVGAVEIGGSVVGGSGEGSGSYLSGAVTKSIVLDGAIVGGGGLRSGQVQSSGNVTTVTIGQDEAGDSIRGGTGEKSGGLIIGGNAPAKAGTITLAGNLRGGTGLDSGGIGVSGDVNKLSIGKSLIGADVPGATAGAAAPTIRQSGMVFAVKIGSMTIEQDIVAGRGEAGRIANSGVIRVGQLDQLNVKGSLLGQAENPVVISATGGIGAQALKNISIGGRVEFAEILAGYGIEEDGFNLRGTLANADASIGNVVVNGSVKGLNIVAGGAAGVDGRFGTADDRLISGTNVTDVAKTISQIASVIIKGAILANDASFGVIAQHIVSLKIGAAGTTPVPLAKGAGNDIATGDTDPDPGVLIAPGTNFRAVELPLPA